MSTLWQRIHGLPLEQDFVVRMYPPPSEMLDSKRYKHRYKLVGPPVQTDTVLRLIHTTVRDMGKDDMWISAAGISVSNLSHGPPLWPPNAQNKRCNIKLYAWKSSGCEFPS